MMEEQPLIKGFFTPEDAREILAALFSSKIQFHTNTAFSIEEQTGDKSHFHRQRASELSSSLKIFLKHLGKCDPKDRVKIDCVVNLSLVKEKRAKREKV